MLSNPFYVGILEYGRTTVAPKAVQVAIGKSRMNFDEPRYARVEGAMPVVIPRELFDRAQAVHASKAGVNEIRKAFEPVNRQAQIDEWERRTREAVQRTEADLAYVRMALSSLCARRQRLDADYDAGDLPASF